MSRVLLLSIIFFSIWFALSGHNDTFFLTIGVVVTALCILIVNRMRDSEVVNGLDLSGHFVRQLVGYVVYFVWLLKEIMNSAWIVTQIIIDPKLPINPNTVKIRASQRTSLGLVVFANSITLTPGTLTIDITGQELMVHSLVRGGGDDLEGGIMDAKITALECTE